MTSRLIRLLGVGILAISILPQPSDAKDALSAKSKRVQLIEKFSLSRPGVELTRDELEQDKAQSTTAETSRRSLGTSASAAGPVGISLRKSYDDAGGVYEGRTVEARGNSDIHFAYSDMATASANTEGYGYQQYDPVAGTWPHGLGLGCRVQSTDGTERGTTGYLAVNPEGLVMLSGRDNVGQPRDNHIYYQTGAQSCFWGGGSRIPPAKYKIGFAAPIDTSKFAEPLVAIQIVGSDTIIHVTGSMANFYAFPGSTGLTETVIQYFRKVNGWGNTHDSTWIGPTTIDTAHSRAFICASRVSSKVALVYQEITPTGYTETASRNATGTTTLDVDCFYRESTNGGVTWNPEVNITNYDRNQKSYGPRNDFHGMYDSNDKLHIVWHADGWPAGVYDSASFFFFDFSKSIFHWSNASGTGVISRVKNADWGLAWNTQVCGFNSSYARDATIGECNGFLYVVFSQIHDIKNPGDITDSINNIFNDCATSGGNQGRPGMANREVWVSVSSDLTGLLWDAPRNLTDTYTPQCDSASGGGVCYSEMKPVIAEQGFNASGFIWPGTEVVVPVNGTAGSQYINLTFIEDHWPGTWAGVAAAGAGVVSEGDVKWVRMACVNPITAAQITASPTSVGYPEYVKHGQTAVHTVTVTNDGNATLNITTIGNVETSPVSNWLTTSVSSLNVPAGVGNTGTFNVTLNNAGIINSPGTVVSLNGYVYLKSNAANDDSLVIEVDNFIVADTIVDVKWDTVRTNVSGTPKVALVVGSHGNSGRGGLGRVNLDYAANGAFECDTTKDVYLYDGGPLLIRQIGASYSFTSSAFQGTFATPIAFKPVNNPSRQPASLSTAAYDGFYTGQSVNEDSTIAMERTFYAPKNGTDSSDFVVICTKFYSYTGSAYNNVMFADIIDWDLPADIGATNKTGIEDGTVYARGTDTGAAGACPNNNRFGAQRFLGLKFTSQGNCANDINLHGQYAARNDSDVFTAPNGVLDSAKAWTKSAALTGSTALAPSQDSTDVHIVTVYKHNVTLPASDTLVVYTAVTTVRGGSVSDLSANFAAACAWYQNNLRIGCTVCGCCIGSVGNVDADPGDAVDISDLTVLIDHLFINNAPLVCPDEGNTDGNPGVDISDLTVLIDHLFINNNPLPAC